MILEGDCIERMAEMDEASVDAIVTDPPYGLEFMGKEWDRFVPEQRRRKEWDGRRRNAQGEDWERKAKMRAGDGGAGPSFSIASHYKPVRQCENCGGWEYGHVERGKGGMKCRCDAPSFGYRIRQEAPTQLLAFQSWSQAWATEALRILKPGGHLLAFGGTRTYHRLACAIEDAGFEIRDSILSIGGGGVPEPTGLHAWIYGSG